jgi:tripartite-type tricarboxylate transporter receptor subunit TctC
MEDEMKKVFKVISLVAVVMCASLSLYSADAKYPSKPIQVIVPAGPGGDTDLNARMLAKYLEKELGQPVVIVNVNGAGGTLGTRKVKDSDADGYTVVFYHPSLFLNKIMGLVDYTYTEFENAGISVMDDTNIFIVNASSPYQNLKDVTGAAKAKPGTLKFATETGGFTHLQVLAYQDAAKVKLNVVDVGSAAQRTVALLGKQVDMIGIQYGIVKDYISSGKFRVVGVLAEKRNPMIPEVKTFKEQGVNIAFSKFFYYMFPKKTPAAVVNRFSAALKKVSTNKDLKADLNKFMVTPVYMAPAEANKYMKTQDALYNKYKDLILNSKVIKEPAPSPAAK